MSEPALNDSGLNATTGNTDSRIDVDYDLLMAGGESGAKQSSRNGDVDTGKRDSSQPKEESHSDSKDNPAPPLVDQTSDEVAEDDEYADYTPRERALMKRLEEVTAEKLDKQPAASTDEPEEFVPQEQDFLADLDLDEVLSSSENLNKLLGSVYNKALQDAAKLSAERIMRTLPATMSNYVSQHLSMRELVNNFYEENGDLKGARKTVTDVANKIANENPELSVEEVFAKTAEEARKVLNLKKVEPKVDKKPTLHNSRGNGARSRLQIPELDGLAREVNELIS